MPTFAPFKEELGFFDGDLEVQLVDIVVKLAAARRVMGRQLRTARILKKTQRKELMARLRNPP
jgi:hypothetical protein